VEAVDEHRDEKKDASEKQAEVIKSFELVVLEVCIPGGQSLITQVAESLPL
jgi:hypothetical protein